jgi:hypothetical protein
LMSANNCDAAFGTLSVSFCRLVSRLVSLSW